MPEAVGMIWSCLRAGKMERRGREGLGNQEGTRFTGARGARDSQPMARQERGFRQKACGNPHRAPWILGVSDANACLQVLYKMSFYNKTHPKNKRKSNMFQSFTNICD